LHSIPNPKLFLLHLRHALQAFQDDFEPLPRCTRADLALTVTEASRFPDMAWKRFAVSQAEAATRDMDDQYLSSCIANSQCLVSRIGGDMHRAVSSLGSLGAPNQGRLLNTMDKRMHSTFGQTLIQQSLNCLQVEDLPGARRLLDSWGPLNSDLSPVEEVVLFRKDLILGRALRFHGEFERAMEHLEKSRNRAQQCKDLIFDEDLRDLTCELADALRELDNPASAERHLRTEIGRRGLYASPGGCLLELSLAEVLFAQERYGEAERLCLDIETRPGLLKFEKLRLYITLAKIRHINSDWEGASRYWASALVAVSKFPSESSVTRTIVISVIDILGRQGVQSSDDLLDQSLKSVGTLGKLTKLKPGGVRCWIAGLRHWVEYLRSQNTMLRSHI